MLKNWSGSPVKSSVSFSTFTRGPDPLPPAGPPTRRMQDQSVRFTLARGHRTVARAWRGHGAGVARAVGHFLAWVARAWRGHGAGVARACPPRGANRRLKSGVCNCGEIRRTFRRWRPISSQDPTGPNFSGTLSK
eukprot:gene15470-biopygen11236